MKVCVRRAKNGFSLIELTVVISLLVVMSALALPFLMQSVHMFRLRGAASDLSGLLQVCRMRAVQDDRYYSVYLSATSGLQQQFVDIYPQNANGVSGTGGQTLTAPDPSVVLSQEISRQPQSAAPNTAALAQLLLPTNPNNLQPKDASAGATPFTFGPEGLPCKPVVSAIASGSGTVCNSKGGSIAYWTFFQNNLTQAWMAVTVTPAGRFQQWYYDGGTWAKL